MSLKAQLKHYRKEMAQSIAQKRCHRKQFTIVSNNCWAGQIYQNLDMAYQTPFIGLLIFAPCYIKLIKNLRTYLESEILFISNSCYGIANEYRANGHWKQYPIGLLKNDVEIHFMHYESELEAQEKWSRRIQRIEWNDPDSLFFKFCDRDLCTPELIREFDQIDLPHKVCFTSQPYPDLNSTIWVKECQKDGMVVDGASLYYVGQKYFDMIDWLNGRSGHLQPTQKILNTLLGA